MKELPVLILLYNRPKHTRRLIHALAQFPGLRIFAAIDGPRPERAGERELTDAVAEELQQAPNLTLEAIWRETENLGCGPAVGLALRKFFSVNSRGVILEDDCMPCPEFFDYAQWALDAFQGDPRIGVISGVNYVPSSLTAGMPVYLSRYPQIWGWATWASRMRGFSHRSTLSRRALARSPQWKALSSLERIDWLRKFRDSRATAWKHNWDVQLVHHLWSRGLWSIAPSRTLVSNTGFGADATHTVGPAPTWYRDPLDEGDLSDFLVTLHQTNPQAVTECHPADQWTSSHIYTPRLMNRIKRRLALHLP